MIDVKRYKVLYVEDTKDIYVATMKFLTKFFGDNVTGASNGEEGLEKAQTIQFDIVITDLKMPKLNGHDMVAKIRETNPDVKVIVLTASDSRMDYSLTKCDAYLKKPIEFHQFLEALKKVTENID